MMPSAGRCVRCRQPGTVNCTGVCSGCKRIENEKRFEKYVETKADDKPQQAYDDKIRQVSEQIRQVLSGSPAVATVHVRPIFVVTVDMKPDATDEDRRKIYDLEMQVMDQLEGVQFDFNVRRRTFNGA